MSTRLTRKQNEIRLRGLRIPARMIARSHLASLREADPARNGSNVGNVADAASGADSAQGEGQAPPLEEDGHVG